VARDGFDEVFPATVPHRLAERFGDVLAVNWQWQLQLLGVEWHAEAIHNGKPILRPMYDRDLAPSRLYDQEIDLDAVLDPRNPDLSRPQFGHGHAGPEAVVDQQVLHDREHSRSILERRARRTDHQVVVEISPVLVQALL
jgi:hypothetical protein